MPIPVLNLKSGQNKGTGGLDAIYNAQQSEGFSGKVRAAFEEAKRRIAEKKESEATLSSFITGETSSLEGVDSSASFLNEFFSVSDQTTIDISGRKLFIQRTQKEMLITTTV